MEKAPGRRTAEALWKAGGDDRHEGAEILPAQGSCGIRDGRQRQHRFRRVPGGNPPDCPGG